MNKIIDEKIKICVSWLAVVLFAGLIFYLSSQTAAQSTVKSMGITHSMVKTFNLKVDSFVTLKTYEGIIRETAHVIEYLIFGLLVCNALYVSRVRKMYVICLIVCVLYAVSDEIHQIPIPGRAFEIKDMVLDALGVIIGEVLYYFINKKYINGSKNNVR